MSGFIDPPKAIVQLINNYRYSLSNLIPHTSIEYGIDCFYNTVYVKSIQGIIEGEQYKEWITDDWLDRFIRNIVESLPDVEVKPEPIVPEPPSFTEV